MGAQILGSSVKMSNMTLKNGFHSAFLCQLNCEPHCACAIRIEGLEL